MPYVRVTHIQIGDKRIALDAKTTASMPSNRTNGEMDAEGQINIWNHIKWDYGIRVTWPEGWSWAWTVEERGVYVGTLPKRISKLLWKVYGIKLSNATMTFIGNVYSRAGAQLPDKVVYDFSRWFTWKRGKFGDGGSCYWSEHKSARTILRAGGGAAFRMYDPNDPNKGIGRAWILPDKPEPGMVVLFNGYGLNSLFGDHHSGGMSLYMTRILATLLGLSYKKIKLENEGRTSGTMYINGGGSGYLLGTTEQLQRYDRYDMEIVTGDFRCAHCDNLYCVDNGNEAHEFEGATICRGCHRARFANCHICRREFPSRNGPLVEVGQWSGELCCPDCLPANTCGCADCGVRIWNADRHSPYTYVLTVDGADRVLCRHCAQDYARCHTCDTQHRYNELRSVGYEAYCTACEPAARAEYEEQQRLRREAEERRRAERMAAMNNRPSPFSQPRPATPPPTGGLNWTVRIVDHSAPQPEQEEANEQEE